MCLEGLNVLDAVQDPALDLHEYGANTVTSPTFERRLRDIPSIGKIGLVEVLDLDCGLHLKLLYVEKTPDFLRSICIANRWVNFNNLDYSSHYPDYSNALLKSDLCEINAKNPGSQT
jgi:hypothetical protein